MSYNLRSRKRMQEEATCPAPSGVPELPGEENVVESRNRAMANEYILAEVLGHLSETDLRACRLVNILWTQVATRVIARKAEVVNFDKSTDLPRVEALLKIMGPAANLPCRKFQLHSDLIRNASTAKKYLLLTFIEKVSPIVIHLGVVSLSDRLFPRGKPQDMTEFPRLRSLKLDIQLTQMGGRYAALKSNLDYMISVLENSPVLDNVFICVGRDMHYGDAEFLRVIEHVPWNKLARLKLDFRLLDKHFRRIMELGANMILKSFEMVTWNGNTHDETRPRPAGGTFFPLFLERQSSSLETLKLYFDCVVKPQSNCRWPIFPKLKTLKIGVEDDDRWMYRLFSQLSFSSQRFPVLSSVTVSETDFYELDDFFLSADMTPLETVTKLRLDSYVVEHRNKEADARRVIRHLAKLFPRVTDLGVPADLNIMKAIEAEKPWKDMKSLTLLCGRNDENVDSTLTGYTPTECMRIFKLVPGSLEFQLERKMGRRIFKFLYNLETLELGSETVGNYWDGTFSDLSCRLVLLKLKNLKTLDLRGICRLDYQHHRNTLKYISKSVIQKMSKKFEVLYTNLFEDNEA